MVEVPEQRVFDIHIDRLKENVGALSQEIGWLKQENEDLKQRIEALEEIAGVENEHKGV